MAAARGVRLRFAPSPTGHLHLGGLRTCMMNMLVARKNKGKLILRLEDTDQQRLVPGSAEALQQWLGWAGIVPDEGPAGGGHCGPYVQSQRLALYQQHANQLLAEQRAYRCFCSPERLERVRRAAARQGNQQAGYDGACRGLDQQEADERHQAGEANVVRLKAPRSGSTVLEDLNYGTIKFANASIEDQVLLKSDGFPTYHLANVVDDHAMDITHVMRGEEWLSSTAKHLLLYDAFGWRPPAFIHLPLLVNQDKSKLSKRQDGLRVETIHDKGYLPQALVNFVAMLGWVPEDDREIFLTLADLVSAFDVSRLNRSPAVVNMDKLDWIQRQHMQSMESGSETFAAALDFLQTRAPAMYPKAEPQLLSRDSLADVLHISKGTFTTLLELLEKSSYFFVEPDFRAPAALKLLNKVLTPETGAALGMLLGRTAHLSGPAFSRETLAPIFDQVLSDAKTTKKKLQPALRAALTGQRAGPPVLDLMAALGAPRAHRRLAAATMMAWARTKPSPDQ